MTGFLTILLAGLAAHATLLGDFFHDLWVSSNHSFFPLGLLVAGWLFWTRRQELLEVDIPSDDSAAKLQRVRGKRTTTAIGLVVALVLVLTSQLLHSPHLGWASLLLLLGTVAYSEYGSKGSYAVLPILILLFFLRPVPGFYEPWLQLGLQWMASRFASMLLDFLRIFHYSEGVVIGLVGQEGLADSLCAGVRWLYVAMFAAIAWGIHLRHHWLRVTLNVIQAIFWVVVWNAVRVAVVLANQESGGTWIDSSFALTLLDYLCLGLILFFMWSGDQLFASIVPRPSNESSDVDEVQPRAEASLAPAWNASPLVMGLGFGFAFVALMSFRFLAVNGSSWLSATADTKLSNIELPSDLDGWKIESMETEERTLYDGSVAQVQRWVIEREGKKLMLDVAGPLPVYPGENWRWNWYGWRTSNAEVADTANADGGNILFHTIKLDRLPGESGASAGIGLDRNRRPLVSAEPVDQVYGIFGAWTSALQYALGIGSLEKARESSIGHPAYSVTLHWDSVKPLSPDQLRELSGAFRLLLPKLTSASE